MRDRCHRTSLTSRAWDSRDRARARRADAAERVAFVLHEIFAVPFDQIAPIVYRSPVATEKLARRARRRVRGRPAPDADLAKHRHVVDAFLTAARGGDIAGLLAALGPRRRAPRRPCRPPGWRRHEIRGADAVAEETTGNPLARVAALALVDDTGGIVVAPLGRQFAVLRLVVEDDTVAEIDVIADPARLDHSFTNSWRRWVLTVCGEPKSRSATSRLVRPSATSRATASSDVVSAAQPWVRVRR
jgi:hypothetical protein